MKNKKQWLIIIPAIVLLIAAGICCYFLGKRSAEKGYGAESDSEYEKNIAIKREALEGLGDLEGTIYVTGHKSLDIDSVGSAVGYASLLKKLGYDAVPVMLGEANSETKYAFKEAGIDLPESLEDASRLNLILVDHSDPAQAADGIESARVIGVIDHHSAGGMKTNGAVIYEAVPCGSAATVVWMEYRSCGVEIDRDIAAVLLGALLFDTNDLQSETTAKVDRDAFEELATLSGIADTEAFYTEMYKESISYAGMTDEEIFFSDYKEYEAAGAKFAIGCISVYDEENAKDMTERMKALLPDVMKMTGMDMVFAQVYIFHDGISATYLVPYDEFAAGVIEAAFGDRAVFDGTSYVFEPGLSRKKDLVPAITDALTANY